jgi:SagB-type dehydrogenase family enzyme
MQDTDATLRAADVMAVYDTAYRSQAPFVFPADIAILPRCGPWSLQRASTRSECRAPAAALGVLLQLFGAPRTLREVEAALDAAQHDVMRRLIGDLLRGGLLTPVSDDASRGGAWELPDLLFHRAVRRGGFAVRTGVRTEYGAALPPQPAIAPATGAHVRLAHPVQPLPQRLDAALESRRTTYGTDAPPLALLGALLHWTFGEQAVHGFRHRRYPSGGNLHSLRPFVCTSGLDGVTAGVWEYDAPAHALVQRRGVTHALALLLEEAAIGTASGDRHPAVLLVLASEFSQVAHKYTGIAYSLVEKEVGAAMMTLSLVAAALPLACVPVGTGNSALFAEACGVPELQLPSVGELVIAARAPECAA